MINQKRRLYLFIFGFCSLLSLTYVNLKSYSHYAEWEWQLSSKFFDYCVNILPEQGDAKYSVSIVLDSDSLNVLGFPISRNIYADLLRKLSVNQSPRAVAIDVIFGESSQIQESLNLEKALKESAIPVIGSATVTEKWSPQLDYWNRSRKYYFISDGYALDGPFPPLIENLSDVGVSDFHTDQDGVLRWYTLAYRVGGTWVPSLALSAWASAYDAKWKVVVKDGAVIGIELGRDYIDLSGDPLGLGRILLHPRNISVNWRDVSILDLDSASFQDKVAFVGVNVPGISGNQITSLDVRQSPLHIHQFVFEDLMAGRFIQFSYSAEFVLVFISLLFLFSVSFKAVNFNFKRLFILNIFIFILTIVTCIGFFNARFFVSPIIPVIICSLNVGLLYIFKMSNIEKEKAFIKDSFSFFVAPELVHRMIEQRKMPNLDGEIKNIVVVFVDLRNFTGISEKLPPHELVGLMNEFFSMVSEHVLKNEGTIDKFIGDAVMAFWNAPTEVANPKAKALLAAKGMLSEFSLMAEKWKSENYLTVLPEIGVGIHSGDCLVGNVGGKNRFSYTAIGDTVNIASRIEGLCKIYRTPLLFSEGVITEEIQPNFPMFLKIDSVVLKGKTKAIDIYTLEDSKEFIRTWSYLFSLYQNGQFKEMLGKMREIEARPWFSLFEKRARHLIEHKSEIWNGEWNLEEK